MIRMAGDDDDRCLWVRFPEMMDQFDAVCIRKDHVDKRDIEPDFPGGVQRMLFDPWGAGCASSIAQPFQTWNDIGNALFGVLR